MQVDDPPYLSVGTAVSAKYKGAFCEAKVSKVDRVVKCKVTFKSGLGSATVSDNEIKGTLRVGQQVLVKHNDYKDLIEATVTKIQDCSQYTVVFDDGDITTLRRTALCLKSGRHFNESETLDQLPLTHPEHFGIPVMGGRRGRRNRLLKDESSDEEMEEENEPDLEGYTQDIGRVVSVETGENKRGKEKWFPGLIVIPSAQPTVKINIKDEFLIRSFRDDRYYTVPKKEVNEFNRDLTEKIENSGLAEAIQKANKFLDANELPLHWEKSSLFNIAGASDSDDNASDTSDEEQSEEKDRFVAQLYKYMDDSGTPLNKTPTISNKDIDLHRLFRIVDKMGGYNRVTNQNKWKSAVAKMKLPVNQNVANQVKSVYKKCLLSYEGFFRTLGVTMSNPTRAAKKDKGRSLIRDRDRTPISSPRPEREDELSDKFVERKTVAPSVETKPKKKPLEAKDKEPSCKKIKLEPREASGDASDTPSTSSSRPKRQEMKAKDKKPKPIQGEKVKALTEKFEEVLKKEEKVQFTRSKSVTNVKPKDPSKDMVITRQSKEATPSGKLVQKPSKKPTAIASTSTAAASTATKEEESPQDKDKKLRQKKRADNEKSADNIELLHTANIGDKLIVYYGPTNESKVTYEAKVVDIDKDQSGPIYLVHYTGWNTRYDEWIPCNRIAENLSSGVKSKRSKVPAPVNVKQNSNQSGSKPPKRNRLSSVSGRSNPDEKPPRSTTPSSVTSSGSLTKSPVVRSSRIAARQDSKKRRVSSLTDLSIQSDLESDSSESEAELPRTRSGSIKPEESEVRVYKKRASRPSLNIKKRKELVKDEDDTEKEDESSDKIKEKKVKKSKKSSTENSDEDDDDKEVEQLTHPKGRDFDLNQIRSELKGFSKAIKASADETEKSTVSDDSNNEKAPELVKEMTDKIETSKSDLEPNLKGPASPKPEKSSSSDDIYEFKEPEPFEFESRSKLADDKTIKKRPRIFDSLDMEKSSRKRSGGMSPLSPGKSGKLELPEPRTYSRVPKKAIQMSEDEEDSVEEESKNNDDPFDKLIESPSFNIIKTSPEVKVLYSEEVNLFKEPPETSDEYSRDMELSDCESQTRIYTREDTLFSATFAKFSETPDFADKTDEGKAANSDDEEIQAQIQRAIAQNSSTDDDSGDTLINVTLPIKQEEPSTSVIAIASLPTTISESSITKETVDKSTEKNEPENHLKMEVSIEPTEDFSSKKTIDPALQETDSSLLESIVSKPPLILDPQLDNTGKELTVKTGKKIADLILQKFNFIKKNIETKKCEPVSDKAVPSTSGIIAKTDNIPEFKSLEELTEPEQIVDDLKVSEEKAEKKKADSSEGRKGRKVLSKAIIEETDSDTSDSENLIIGSEEEIEEVAEEDDDSQTNSSDNKPLIECKNMDSDLPKSAIIVADGMQSQPIKEEKRNFTFDNVLPKNETKDGEISSVLLSKEEEEKVEEENKEIKLQQEADKEEIKEEQDPNLHSMLLCEEEIPRSPAPEPIAARDAPIASSIHEMPFASAPGTSNSKMLLEPNKKHQPQPPAPLLMPVDRENRPDAQAVIENTPPTTPESTISNLSPRGDNGNASPNSDSKSNEGEPSYSERRRSEPVKVSPYSEEDTQPGSDLSSTRKTDSFGPPVGYRKRRRSQRNSEDGGSSGTSVVPAKRGRKPRQRRDSDSDDASESSMAGSGGGGGGGGGTTPGGNNSAAFERSARSPRPSKYNFFVEFDPSLDSNQRIAVLQQKLAELRKTYADVKAELATVERRRKKIRRREREALKTAKQEMACA